MEHSAPIEQPAAFSLLQRLQEGQPDSALGGQHVQHHENHSFAATHNVTLIFRLPSAALRCIRTVGGSAGQHTLRSTGS
jgi:hypothetical protein